MFKFSEFQCSYHLRVFSHPDETVTEMETILKKILNLLQTVAFVNTSLSNKMPLKLCDLLCDLLQSALESWVPNNTVFFIFVLRRLFTYIHMDNWMFSEDLLPQPQLKEQNMYLTVHLIVCWVQDQSMSSWSDIEMLSYICLL